jgi:2'-5' RNA ligase
MRLFIAVWPPEDVAGRLSALERPAQAGVRWTTPDQWHVTLRFLGSVTDVDGVMEAFSRLDPGPPVTAVAGPVLERLGRGILCLPVSGLSELAQTVVAATARFGEPPPQRPFHGHLTVARAKAGADLRPFAGVPLAAAWPVTEVTLVASETHPDGARYRVVAGVALRP